MKAVIGQQNAKLRRLVVHSIKSLIIFSIIGALVAGCGGGSSSSGGGAATQGFTSDMRGTWDGNIGTATFELNITQATGGENAGTVRFSNGNGGPVSLAKDGNDLQIVIDFPGEDCVGRFFGALTSANSAEGKYRETGGTPGCDFVGKWDMRR